MKEHIGPTMMERAAKNASSDLVLIFIFAGQDFLFVIVANEKVRVFKLNVLYYYHSSFSTAIRNSVLSIVATLKTYVSNIGQTHFKVTGKLFSFFLYTLHLLRHGWHVYVAH